MGARLAQQHPLHKLRSAATKLPPQTLSLNQSGAVVANNSAVLGFGPLGSWRLGIQGVWRDSGDGKTARVLFDQVSVKPVAAMGLAVPSWMPPVSFHLARLLGSIIFGLCKAGPAISLGGKADKGRQEMNGSGHAPIICIDARARLACAQAQVLPPVCLCVWLYHVVGVTPH
ncbi:hypothetical protein Vafri_4185 [Volvox africanus]|uniref:Uncharacterized protein n=1 Tax=Volvox africanus TaxID=51714 RepID=A0A8J4AVU0_9CHLO|nr:hypothetical protein Vafri_4185 [Volvox africanus]